MYKSQIGKLVKIVAPKRGRGRPKGSTKKSKTFQIVSATTRGNTMSAGPGMGNLSVFPNRYSFRGSFAHQIGLNSDAAFASIFGAEQLYNLNNVYRPNAAVGKGMLGSDELGAVYSNYKVNAVKVKIIISNPTLDGLYIGIWFTAPDNTETLVGKTISLVQEKAGTMVIPINNTGSQVVKRTKYVKIQTACGLTEIQFKANVNDYTALFGASPTQQPKLHIACANSASASLSQCSLQLELKFYGVAYDRKTLASST